MNVNWNVVLPSALTGLFTLVGAFGVWLLAGKRDHKRWLLDNKAAEYRKFLDWVNLRIEVIESASSEVEIIEAAINASRASYVVEDPIFTHSELKKGRILEKWEDSTGVIREGQTLESRSEVYQMALSEFRECLREIIRKDLKLDA